MEKYLCVVVVVVVVDMLAVVADNKNVVVFDYDKNVVVVFDYDRNVVVVFDYDRNVVVFDYDRIAVVDYVGYFAVVILDLVGTMDHSAFLRSALVSPNPVVAART